MVIKREKKYKVIHNKVARSIKTKEDIEVTRQQQQKKIHPTKTSFKPSAPERFVIINIAFQPEIKASYNVQANKYCTVLATCPRQGQLTLDIKEN